MKQVILAFMVFSLITFNLGITPPAYSRNGEIAAEKEVVEKIEPALKGTEVALPIVDEETGKILGYVIAEKEKLVPVLKEAGLTEVANALAAMEAGEAAAGTVTAGISGGTITWIAIGVAALAGIGFALGSGGGGGSTSNH
jgi:hypothetical protein